MRVYVVGKPVSFRGQVSLFKQGAYPRIKQHSKEELLYAQTGADYLYKDHNLRLFLDGNQARTYADSLFF